MVHVHYHYTICLSCLPLPWCCQRATVAMQPVATVVPYIPSRQAVQAQSCQSLSHSTHTSTREGSSQGHCDALPPSFVRTDSPVATPQSCINIGASVEVSIVYPTATIVAQLYGTHLVTLLVSACLTCTGGLHVQHSQHNISTHTNTEKTLHLQGRPQRPVILSGLGFVTQRVQGHMQYWSVV